MKIYQFFISKNEDAIIVGMKDDSLKEKNYKSLSLGMLYPGTTIGIEKKIGVIPVINDFPQDNGSINKILGFKMFVENEYMGNITLSKKMLYTQELLTQLIQNAMTSYQKNKEAKAAQAQEAQIQEA